ncbi:MAG: GxxExxY protein [Aridibacter famidurans]|nr:GxxExxY protein [Aridibacter famidurans]
MEINDISGKIIECAIRVHKELGSGLLLNAYEACLLFELHKEGLKARRQVQMPVEYSGVRIDVGYRLDLLVEERVIVELKSVEKMLPIHEAQILTYLKLSGLKLGLLLNFNEKVLKDGIKRISNDL